MKSNIQDLTHAQAKSILQKIASGDDWFDIESAPKDGSWILLFNENEDKKSQSVKWCKWDKSGWGYESKASHFKFLRPTHWKHLNPAKHMAMMIEREVNE